LQWTVTRWVRWYSNRHDMSQGICVPYSLNQAWSQTRASTTGETMDHNSALWRKQKIHVFRKMLLGAVWKCSSLMVSALASASSGLDSSHGWGMFLCYCKRHLTLTVPLSTLVYKWAPTNLMLGDTLQWTRITTRGEYNTPSCFMQQKQEYAPAWWVTWLIWRLYLPTEGT